jgi:hypothetical protein
MSPYRINSATTDLWASALSFSRSILWSSHVRMACLLAVACHTRRG